MSEDGMRKIAVFDFDGTITESDTLAPFLLKFAGTARFLYSALRHAPTMLSAAIGAGNRDAAKEKFLVSLIGGRPEGELVSAGNEYAAFVLREEKFNTEVIERLAWHRAEGHEIVVISASLDVYIQAIAAALGAAKAFGTEIEVESGVLTGRLRGGNVRAANKVKRLEGWLNHTLDHSLDHSPDHSLDREACEIWAYGDSSGDDELLERSDHPHRVKNGQIKAATR